MSQQWHYSQEGAQYGPVDESEIVRLIQSGELPAGTQVCKEGGMDWEPARHHACFQVEISPKKKAPRKAAATTASKEAIQKSSEEPSSGKKSWVKQIPWTKLVRRVHLYLGMFILPLLLMYLISGFYFTLNPARQKTDDEARTIWQKLYWVHTDQQLPRGVSEMIDPLAENQPKTITTFEADSSLFKYFVYTMVIAAVGTMILGVILGIRTSKNKVPLIGTFAAGLIIPFVVLWVGQNEVKKPNPFHPDSVLEDSGPTLPSIQPGKDGSGEPSLQQPGKKE